jgi:dolichol-phosphate mannosyltransferase
MKQKVNVLTIVIPIFNEEDGIERILPAFEEYINQSKFEVLLFLVNDG